MNRRQFEQYLRQHGCFLYRQGGNHEVWVNPANLKPAPVPRHREIKRPLVLAICRQLEIPPPPFK